VLDRREACHRVGVVVHREVVHRVPLLPVEGLRQVVGRDSVEPAVLASQPLLEKALYTQI
tara:strand:- start:211 stop:390 length:180 start_codon:yes stop_codon:yes gene_type:complete